MKNNEWSFIDYEFKRTIKNKHIKLPRSTDIEVETLPCLKPQLKENTFQCLKFRVMCENILDKFPK